MKSSEKVALALDIIPYLSQHNGISRREAAEHFGISPRELHSILEIAVCCGIPGYFGGDLIDIDIWDDNLYVYTAQGLDKPLHLTPAERAAVTLALRQVEKVPGLVNSLQVESILQKLNGIEGSPLTGIAEESHTSEPDETGGFSDTITEALESRRTVVIDYLRATGEKTHNRRLYPLTMAVREGHGYLIAWDVQLKELRQFRLDRIISLDLSFPWDKEPPVSAAQLRAYIDGGEAPLEARVVLRHDAIWLAEILGVTLAETEGEWLPGALPYFSESWLQRMAQRYAPFMVVQEPQHIEKIVVARARAALAR